MFVYVETHGSVRFDIHTKVVSVHTSSAFIRLLCYHVANHSDFGRVHDS